VTPMGSVKRLMFSATLPHEVPVRIDVRADPEPRPDRQEPRDDQHDDDAVPFRGERGLCARPPRTVRETLEHEVDAPPPLGRDPTPKRGIAPLWKRR
jgi:hypothetical protein